MPAYNVHVLLLTHISVYIVFTVSAVCVIDVKWLCVCNYMCSRAVLCE